MENEIKKNISTSKHPILNNEYEIISLLGDGKTSKVYLCRSIEDPDK